MKQESMTAIVGVLFFFQVLSCYSTQMKPSLTLDEYLNFTNYPSIGFSPSGKHLFIKCKRPSWHSNSYENSLWIYDVETQQKTLMTSSLSDLLNPSWSPSGSYLAVSLNQHPSSNITKRNPSTLNLDLQPNEYIYLYSVLSNQWLAVHVGKSQLLAFTWSDSDSLFYFAKTTSVSQGREEDGEQSEWKNVIRYRISKSMIACSIYRIEIGPEEQYLNMKRFHVTTIPFLMSELLFVPALDKLIFISTSTVIENIDSIEIYSLNLREISDIRRLTNNHFWERDLRMSSDRRHLVFLSFGWDVSRGKLSGIQQRLYSLDLFNGNIERFGKEFHGSVTGYSIKPGGGLYILGQVATETQVFTQESTTEEMISHPGLNGTYEQISVSPKANSYIAFIHSSLDRAKEVYLVDNILQLESPRALTNENELFAKRDLPKTEVIQWQNNDDQRTIEGILHYPPGKYHAKHLPLLVLIHGGPGPSSLNAFTADWYNWATLAASEGWLVLEPNYRGSFGYGDEFHNEVFGRPLSLPGRDILSGVDQLIDSRIADPTRLAVGGYSYGGFLTNWLITQTTRFNAALSGAGEAEHTSSWGTIHMPILVTRLLGGHPWEAIENYINESPIYHLSRVRTPTHIVTGENDESVKPGQSLTFERGLQYLGVTVQLLMFPNEGHALNKNPWHGKIKVREELKWLRKYANRSSNANRN